MTDNQRIKLVEDAILLLKDLAVNHNERMDDFHSALENERREREESRKDFEFKLNALIDAQIRNEMEIREFRESTKDLKDASQAQLKRIEVLENK